ncbi:50S ribosomal protein L18 [bacterium]|nr:50S ribosomal protein L18 [bacterium]
MLSKVKARKRRHIRVRKKVFGTAERPRLCVFRSLKHIYAQLINDEIGHTYCSASSLDREIKEVAEGKNKKEIAKEVGKLLAKRALELGIEKAVFDRAGYKYHGRVQALAEGAREGGLKL